MNEAGDGHALVLACGVAAGCDSLPARAADGFGGRMVGSGCPASEPHDFGYGERPGIAVSAARLSDTALAEVQSRAGCVPRGGCG